MKNLRKNIQKNGESSFFIMANQTKGRDFII